MNIFDRLRCKENQYSSLGLKENPFSINPLFRNFRDKESSRREEQLFVLSKEQEQIFQILNYLKDKRALVYGLFGVGKTSFIDGIFYVAYNYHNRFCVRTIITEDNVGKAINELLLSLCYDLLWEISHKNLFKPIENYKRWLANRRYKDVLFEYLLKLAGSYTETHERVKASRKKTSGKAGMPIASIQVDYDSQREIKKSLQSYVDILPMKNVAEYLSDFSEIITLLGFEDIIIFIDEADHLTKMDEFLRFLTKAREVLFSTGYTFFVAGSEDIARYTESMGSIFDKLVFIKPADRSTFQKILTARLKFVHPTGELKQLFEKQALDFIFENSGGVRKLFLRMAENAIDTAAVKAHKKVLLEDCLEVVDIGKNRITSSLTSLEIQILQNLAKKGKKSASDESFQKNVNLKRVSLRKQLEQLLEKGYIRKEREGKKYLYYIASQYKKYFESC